MPITALPTPPSRQDPTNFNDRADTFLGALPTFATEANALQANVNTSESNAVAASNAAIAATNIVKWVSGVTYTEGAVVWSPINGLAYRRMTAAGSGTTDPSADGTNYKQVSGTGNVSTSGNQTIDGVKTFTSTIQGTITNATTAQNTRYGGGNISTNIANGNNALSANTIGSENTAIGSAAMQANVDGFRNTAVGVDSLKSANFSIVNSAYGYGSLRDALTANYNTAIGSNSAMVLKSGDCNTGVGFGSLNPTNTNRYAAHCTAVGYQALASISATVDVETWSNTAIGSGALSTCGKYDNTAVGYQALNNNPNYYNCSGLGAYTSITGNNQVQLGSSTTTTYVYGTVQNRSDIRDKADVQDTKLGLKFIEALRPVDYRWDMRESYRPDSKNAPVLPEAPSSDATEEDLKDYELAMQEYRKNLEDWTEKNKLSNIQRDGSHKRNRFHHGLIAQEVKQTMDNLGVDFGGYQDHSVNGGDDVLSIGYDELIAPLIKAVQELSARVKQLEANQP